MTRFWSILCGALMVHLSFPGVRSAERTADPLPIPHPSLEKSGAEVKSDVQEERKRFDAIIQSSPPASASQRAQAYSKLARIYHAYEFYDAALACYQNLDRVQPGIYPCLYAIGWIYHEQGRFDEALRSLADAKKIAAGLSDTPTSVRVAMNCLIGDCSLKLAKLAEAMTAFQEALQMDQRCAYAWHGLGLVHSMQENSRAAIQCLERAIALQPYASSGRVLLVREYRKAGLADSATQILSSSDNNRTVPFAFYDPIISRDVAPLNRSASSLHSRGLVAKQQGNAPLAVTLFKQAIELNPRFTAAKANLASTYLNLNQLEEAESLSQQILDEQPSDASFHDLRGGVLFKRGRFDEALRSFQKAQELEPNRGTHAYWIGAVLSWQGNHQDALAMFEKAAQLNNADADAQIGEAIMLARLGKGSEALERLRRCVELFPGSIQAKLNLAQCLSADANATPADGEKAVALARPIFEQVKSVPAAVALAMAYAATANFSKAIDVQKWAIDHAAEQGQSADLAWLKRNLARYEESKPSREPWNSEKGYP